MRAREAVGVAVTLAAVAALVDHFNVREHQRLRGLLADARRRAVDQSFEHQHLRAAVIEAQEHALPILRKLLAKPHDVCDGALVIWDDPSGNECMLDLPLTPDEERLLVALEPIVKKGT